MACNTAEKKVVFAVVVSLHVFHAQHHRYHNDNYGVYDHKRFWYPNSWPGF